MGYSLLLALNCIICVDLFHSVLQTCPLLLSRWYSTMILLLGPQGNNSYALLSSSVMVFPVVMYGCESWTIKIAERRIIDAFELWCWRKLLRVPWTARRSNQPILNHISPGCSLEGLMLKLKLQYFGHLMWRADSSEKTLMLGKIEDRRRRGWQRMGRLNGITDLMDMGLGRLWQLVMVREAWRVAVHEVAKSWTWLRDWTDWTELTVIVSPPVSYMENWHWMLVDNHTYKHQ